MVDEQIIDLSNPRHPNQTSQRDAIHTIAHEQGAKLYALAEDIVKMGLNPSELPLVTPADQEDMYTVLEGNRRVTALKLLTSPQLLASVNLPANLDSKYRALRMSAGNDIPPLHQLCRNFE